MKTRTRTQIGKSEQGMASFVVTFILMLIISLVALSFAQIIRREQRQALDRHLSARAFYAAESGINLASEALENGYTVAKPNCEADASLPSGVPASLTPRLDSASYMLDAANGTEVTCLTIDNTPTSLEYPTVPKGKSLVVPIFPQSSMNRIELSWQSTTANSTTSYAACATTNGLTPQASWACSAPLLRIDLIEVTSGMNRDSLVNNLYSAFMYPTSGSGSTNVNYTSGSRGNMPSARCSTANTPGHCRVTLQMGGSSTRQYYARIVSYYTDAKLTITSSNGGGVGSGPVELAGAQAVIDSTGKAQDVVRRLQVRKSLSSIGVIPEFGIESAAGLCKRYLVMTGNGTSGNSVLNVQSGGTLDDGSPCALTLNGQPL